MPNPPILIDELIKNSAKYTENCALVGKKYYIAKPVAFFGFSTIKSRVWHSWLVLTGRAFAVEYMEDRAQRQEKGE